MLVVKRFEAGDNRVSCAKGSGLKSLQDDGRNVKVTLRPSKVCNDPHKKFDK